MKKMFQDFSKTALITGVNRGLGLELMRIVSKLKEFQLIATAREPKDVEEICLKEKIYAKKILKMDLFNSKATEFINLINSNGPYDLVIHCASPYETRSLIETDTLTIEQHYTAMKNDTIIGKAATKNLNTGGSLIFTGAVIGLPTFVEKGVIGLLKNNLRQLSSVLAYEAKENVHIRHLNIGTFRDKVEDPNAALTTTSLAEKIIDLGIHPKKYAGVHIDCLPNSELKYAINSTTSPYENKGGIIL